MLLFPDSAYKSAYEIPYVELYSRGYRGIIFDIDNTLVEHGEPADERSKELIKNIKDIGLKVCLISNNTEDRVKPFAEAVGSDYVYHASKPFTREYKHAMTIMGTDKSNTVFVGDQIYTDIVGGNLSGIYTILVTPMKQDPDTWIRVKRKLEKPVLALYHINVKTKS